jgi:enediyne biosynthesis protein E4
MILQVLLLGCRTEPAIFADPAPADTMYAEPVACADPAARDERAFDVVEIPADGLDYHRFMGAGIVAADFDGDGDHDLLAPGPNRARLLLNDGRGGFDDDPEALPPLDYTLAVGGAAADFDADGDLDVVITRYLAPDHLLRNEGGWFVAHDGPEMPPAASQSATFGDLDVDGDLDLLVAGHGAIEAGLQVTITEPGEPSRLWLGDGAGGFVDATEQIDARIHDGYSFVIGVTDVDADRVPDLMVANDYASYIPTLAGRNRGNADFVADDGELGLNVVAAGMGLGIGDINDDGLDDFLLPVWDRIVVLRSSGAGRWVNASQALDFRVPRPETDGTDGEWIGWGGEWVDLESDGDLDALIAFGHLDTIVEYSPSGNPTDNAADQEMVALINDGTGGPFTSGAAEFEIDRVGVWRGFAVADLNGDGWPDIAARDLSGYIVVWLSRCGDAGWLTVKPGPVDLAVGAEIEVVAGDRTWLRRIHAGGTSLASSGPPEATIGLGDRDLVDDVIVRWPDGAEAHTGPLPTRQIVRVPRPE